ncbi:hypothetical protein IWQ61_005425 [Dispira simplex]|nr:hypothetical protein IWQ61_005425 [Dispira simplex]
MKFNLGVLCLATLAVSITAGPTNLVAPEGGSSSNASLNSADMPPAGSATEPQEQVLNPDSAAQPNDVAIPQSTPNAAAPAVEPQPEEELSPGMIGLVWLPTKDGHPIILGGPKNKDTTSVPNSSPGSGGPVGIAKGTDVPSDQPNGNALDKRHEDKQSLLGGLKDNVLNPVLGGVSGGLLNPKARGLVGSLLEPAVGLVRDDLDHLIDGAGDALDSDVDIDLDNWLN